jgi:hypothetical protein
MSAAYSAIRIIGSKDVLQAVIAGKQNTNGNVRGFVLKNGAPEERTCQPTETRIFIG